MYTLQVTGNLSNSIMNCPDMCCCCGRGDATKSLWVSMKNPQNIYERRKRRTPIKDKKYLNFPICKECIAWVASQQVKKTFLMLNSCYFILGFIGLFTVILSPAKEDLELLLKFFLIIYLVTMFPFVIIMLIRRPKKTSSICHPTPVKYLGYSNNTHTLEFSNRDFYERWMAINQV
jgi:hypothetical protein